MVHIAPPLLLEILKVWKHFPLFPVFLPGVENSATLLSMAGAQ
jgi:hypothetical protein